MARDNQPRNSLPIIEQGLYPQFFLEGKLGPFPSHPYLLPNTSFGIDAQDMDIILAGIMTEVGRMGEWAFVKRSQVITIAQSIPSIIADTRVIEPILDYMIDEFGLLDSIIYAGEEYISPTPQGAKKFLSKGIQLLF